MGAFIVTFIVGLALIFIGVLNTKGNISMLHSYHIKNVKEEDKIPFGKLVGLGMFIMGGGIIVFGGFGIASLYAQMQSLVLIGEVIMAVGIVVGTIITFYAMKKYNGGIFK